MQYYFMMSCEIPWNHKQVALNWKDRSVSFPAFPLPRSGIHTTQDLHPENHNELMKECSANESSLLATRHLSGSESRIIQESHQANQLSVNGSNVAKSSSLLQQQHLFSNKANATEVFHPSAVRMPLNRSNGNAYLQHHQLSSERVHMIRGFHPATYQLPPNESNISKQACHPFPRPLSNGVIMRQNFNIVNQQLPVNTPQISLTNYVLSQNDFGRNLVKYPPDHQPSERTCQSLHSIFERHSNDRVGILQNQYIPSHTSVPNQGSYPLSTGFHEMEFNINRELPVPCMRLHQTFPQYSEKVHVCVVGPPRCGKADIIRAFAKNDEIRIPTYKPLSLVHQQGMISFGTTLKIDVWHGEDLTSVADDLRSLCESSKSVIVLVYSSTQKSSLLTVEEWIKTLKKVIAVDVPIILIGNATDVDSRQFSEVTSDFVKFSEGDRMKVEYELAVFYECSAKCVADIEKIFLVAAFKAFKRTIKKPIRGW